jgi:hypothetical protein
VTIQTFSNDADGLALANAVPDPKHLWFDRALIRVMTGDDLPTTLTATDIVLNRLGLFQGAFLAGGQPLLTKFMTYVYTTIPAGGTPTQKNFWRECAAFSRGTVFINQLRTDAGMTNAEMDQVFVLGNGYTP